MYKNLNLTIKTKIVSTLFQEVIYTSTIPFISFYFLDILSKKETGFILTFGVIMSLVASLIGGHIGNSYNKKKIILVSQIFMSLCLFTMFIGLINNLIVVFIFSFVGFNIGWGLQYPVLSAFIMNSITENEDYIYSIIYWITNLGVAVGSILGSLAYLYFPKLLLLFAAITYTLITLMYLFGFKDLGVSKEIEEKKNIFHQYVNAFKQTKILKLIFGSLFLMFGELTLYSYIAIKLKEQFQLFTLGSFSIDGVKMYSTILLTNTIIIVFLTFAITKFFKRFNYKTSMLISIGIYILGYAFASYSNNFYILIITVSLATVGEIIYAPGYNVAKYNIISVDDRDVFEAIDSILFYVTDSFAKYMIVISIYFNNFANSLIIFSIMLVGGILLYSNMFTEKKVLKN